MLERAYYHLAGRFSMISFALFIAVAALVVMPAYAEPPVQMITLEPGPPSSPSSGVPPERQAFDIGHKAYEKEDYKTAERYYGLACEGGFGTGCFNLGLMHANGKLGDVNFPKAADYYKLGCDKDDQQSCNNLGVQYQNGYGVALDASEATRYFRKSCKLAADVGCANLSVMLAKNLDEKKPKDPRWREIAALNKRACENHPHGCLRYGYNLSEGLGVPRDEAVAAEHFLTACDGGYSSGCYNLGEAYARAAGVKRDMAKSASFFARSCHFANAEGCYESGLLLMRGEGVQRDETKALDQFESACAGGPGGSSGGGDPVAAACGAAGYLHWERHDVENAKRFAINGCMRGDGNSCLLAALTDHDGPAIQTVGVVHGWFDRAAKSKPKADAAALRAIVAYLKASRITSNDISGYSLPDIAPVDAALRRAFFNAPGR